MSKPPSLSLDLEIAFEESEAGKPLILDLWKGFSALVAVKVLNHDEPSDAQPPRAPGPDGWQYTSPIAGCYDDHYEAYGLSVSTLDFHIAQALNKRLLVIRDSSGETIPINDTDNSELLQDQYKIVVPVSPHSVLHALSVPGNGMLQQLRQKLRPGSDYTLQLASRTHPLQIFFGNNSFDESTLNVPCAPTTIRF